MDIFTYISLYRLIKILIKCKNTVKFILKIVKYVYYLVNFCGIIKKSMVQFPVADKRNAHPLFVRKLCNVHNLKDFLGGIFSYGISNY